MKNIFKSVIVCIFISIALYACVKENHSYNSNLKNSSPSCILDEYNVYGNIHNLALTNINNCFQIDTSIRYLDDGIRFINDFNKSFITSLNLNENEQQEYELKLDQSSQFVNTNWFYEQLYLQEEGKYNLISNIQLSFDNKLIDQYEYEKLIYISQKVQEHYLNTISYENLEEIIKEIKGEYLKQNYSKDTKYGHLLAITLNISLYSFEWWKNNPSALNTKLPFWAGADIAGAIIGGANAVIGGYASTGSVNWGSVAIGAGTGAILGSTGVVGKVGKWISSLF